MERLACTLAAVVAAVVGTASCSAPSPSTSTGLPTGGHVHALRTAGSGQLLLGLHGALWSSDDGIDWEQMALDGQDAMGLGELQDGAPFLVGGHDVLERSVDGGGSFTSLSPPGLPTLDIHALAQAPSDPDIVHAFVAGNGLFSSIDGGDTWQPAATSGQPLPVDVTAMTVDPSDPDVVLVGSPSSGILRSDDGGRSFGGVTPTATIGLAFGPDNEVLAATQQGVDASTDGGVNWTNLAPMTDFAGQPIAVTFRDDARWVVTEDSRGLYRATGDAFQRVDLS